MHRFAAALIFGIAVFCGPLPASAQSEISGPEAFAGKIDLRLSAVGGETGWLDGGFGKLREGGSDGDTQPRLRVASVDLVWKPRFSYSLSGLVSITHQDGQSNDVDFTQAFLKYRTGPGKTRLDVRAGIFWPPVSQEHGGPDWGVVDTITPSAANSWIAEEVQVLGFEGTFEQRVGTHEVKLTGAIFRNNDMSGTLLTYRGWAMHDLRTTVQSDMPLPPLSPGTAARQDSITTPWLELDNRPGFYARAEWLPPAPVSLNVFYYDNRGDRVTSRNKQTSWHTRFWNVGAVAALGDRTVVKSQMLWGKTLVGPHLPIGDPVDLDFATAYLLVSREIGRGKLTIRGDWFKTWDRGFALGGTGGEYGWAQTIAYKHGIAPHLDALTEVLHVDSEREGRQLRSGIAEKQDQTLVQASLRFGF